jgi:phosphatidylglycerophosphate synthase
MSSEHPSSPHWQTKPSDRFVLKWIKCNLSAAVTPHLTQVAWLRPWMVTVCAMCTGVLGGMLFACGWGLAAGLIAALSQILDGVDGQFARLTGRQSPQGAFLDSVLDRYSDGTLVIGLTLYCAGLPLPLVLVGALGTFALIGSGLISYSSARAESLGLSLGSPTLASKGTRTAVTALSGMFSPWFPFAPFLALCYLVAHTNVVVVTRILRVFRASEGQG